MLQFSELVLCTSLFDERLNAVSTTAKRQSTLAERIPFNMFFRGVFQEVCVLWVSAPKSLQNFGFGCRLAGPDPPASLVAAVPLVL